jgi:hypothetical protein
LYVSYFICSFGGLSHSSEFELQLELGSFGQLAYVWQVVSGIFLAMHFGVEGVVGLQAGPVARSVVGADTVVMPQEQISVC